MLFQCDLTLQMKEFCGDYSSFLNSNDLYDPDLALRTPRCFGGTMAMWKIEYDPFIHIVPVKSSSFLPLVFDPPGVPLSIHIAIYLPTAGRDSEFVEELSELDSCISEARC